MCFRFPGFGVLWVLCLRVFGLLLVFGVGFGAMAMLVVCVVVTVFCGLVQYWPRLFGFDCYLVMLVLWFAVCGCLFTGFVFDLRSLCLLRLSCLLVLLVFGCWVFSVCFGFWFAAG